MRVTSLNAHSNNLQFDFHRNSRELEVVEVQCDSVIWFKKMNEFSTKREELNQTSAHNQSIESINIFNISIHTRYHFVMIENVRAHQRLGSNL